MNRRSEKILHLYHLTGPWRGEEWPSGRRKEGDKGEMDTAPLYTLARPPQPRLNTSHLTLLSGSGLDARTYLHRPQRNPSPGNARRGLCAEEQCGEWRGKTRSSAEWT